jgi:POT family proton-dependent oligopeptide transporter
MNEKERHPPGLYVLFFTEMWERFGFYTMLAMFVLYLQNKEQGFGLPEKQATLLYSVYIGCVYGSPLVGGFLADRKQAYRNAVLLGGLIFMAGYFLLSIHSLIAVYAALVCLVAGNGLFKPNVSTMVGRLYPEGSHLKDRAFNVFYMGINIGALAAPLAAALIQNWVGYRWGFLAAGLGMIASVVILWVFRGHVEPAPQLPPSPSTPAARPNLVEGVPEWQRISALLVIFVGSVVFWMVYSQNGLTITKWARDNTDWSMSGLSSLVRNEDAFGILSNVINPFWVVTLSLPVVWLWKALDRRRREPATPAKMALGTVLLGLAFFVLAGAARADEQGLTWETRYNFRTSLGWLIGFYFLVTVGELFLSPMGLSLVSKVAPRRLRGVMMGGWFLATAVGNSLTAIGVYWEEWWHSTFFAVLGCTATGMGLILFFLLRPLKKAMPGV